MSTPGAARRGVAYLVGAGPGDPGLMTARALELVAAADVVLYDRLIGERVLDGARPDAELVYVGKRPGAAAMSQEEIAELIVERARAGRSVVRLKGGDPFVFGRGGEEAEALEAAGIPFEVVPGITAGIAAPAYAGIPVTHRDDASAVAFVTGHEDPAKPDTAIDWDALAAFPGTLVLYMGLGRVGEIAGALIDAGRQADEPAAVIERGTRPEQRTVTAPLSGLAEAVAAAGLGAPAIILVGRVARRRERIAWLERRPLHGLRVVVTRARAQAGATAARLRALGAEVAELPVIRIEPLLDERVAAAIERIDEHDIVCLTSPNAVELLFGALARGGRDARALAGCAVAAIGPGTARELAGHGIEADVVPARSVAECLLEELSATDLQGKSVLIARAAEAREVLPEGLRERGAEVEILPLYETVAEPLGEEGIELAERADYLTFTSASTVSNFAAALGGSFPAAARVVSIGPVTSARARELGIEVHVEASSHDPDGLIDALLADVAARGAAGSVPE